jgi:hypothetical protein
MISLFLTLMSMLEPATVSSPPTARLTQAEVPCANTDSVPPSDAMRELALEQFGISVMIPENYRAIEAPGA